MEGGRVWRAELEVHHQYSHFIEKREAVEEVARQRAQVVVVESSVTHKQQTTMELHNRLAANAAGCSS